MWFYIYIIYNMTWLEYMYCCTKSILPFCTLEFLKSWFLLVSFSIYNERAYKNRLFKESSHWTKFSLSSSFFDLRSSLLNKKRRTWRHFSQNFCLSQRFKFWFILFSFFFVTDQAERTTQVSNRADMRM